METQWQRALEIISTGTPDDDCEDRHQSTKKNHSQRDPIGLGKGKSENEIFETPTNNRLSKKLADGQCSGDDKLQSFIDLVI